MPDPQGSPYDPSALLAWVDENLEAIREWNRLAAESIARIERENEVPPITYTQATNWTPMFGAPEPPPVPRPSRDAVQYGLNFLVTRLPAELDELKEEKKPKLIHQFIYWVKSRGRLYGRSAPQLEVADPEVFWPLVFTYGEVQAAWVAHCERDESTFEIEVDRGLYDDAETAQETIGSELEERRADALNAFIEGVINV